MKIALGQMCSADAHGPNIETMQGFAQQAARDGAEMLFLPEVAGLMNRDGAASARIVGPADTDPYIAAAQTAARANGLWMHAGSTPVAGPDGKFLNRSVVIGPDGAIAAHYDKIHLFDINLDGADAFRESKRFAAGDRAVTVEAGGLRLGLSICYDLRFAYLYRDLAKAGAQVLCVPAAFTVPTGRAHWEILLRARAIETGAFVIAAAQVGTHADGRKTWGHSLIVDPWGEVVLDMGGDAPGLALADLDLQAVTKARAQIPALSHDRSYRLVP